MTSLQKLKKDLEIVQRAVMPNDTSKADEVQRLLRQLEAIPMEVQKEAAKEVAKMYAEGKI